MYSIYQRSLSIARRGDQASIRSVYCYSATLHIQTDYFTLSPLDSALMASVQSFSLPSTGMCRRRDQCPSCQSEESVSDNHPIPGQSEESASNR